QLGHSPVGSWHRSAHNPDLARSWGSANHRKIPAFVAEASPSCREPDGELDPRRGERDHPPVSPQEGGMSRPAVEVADILRAQGNRFLDRYESSFDYQQLKAFRAIQNCRTAALGGHLDSCSQCGRQAISYNSCRNRHCPKCQAQVRERWIAKREQELL